MNAIRTPRLRASCFSLAIFLTASGIASAEVGVAIAPGGTQLKTVYTLQIVDDPTPFNGVWAQLAMNDNTRIVLNAGGELNGDGPPCVTTNSDSSQAAAAWSKNSPSGFDVVVSRFVGGAWTAAQVVAGTSANELDPQLVFEPNGSVHLFYWVDGATPEVFHTVATADFSSWTTPVRVSQAGEAACRPAGAFYSGVLRVAYEVHTFGSGTSPRQVVLSRLVNGAFTPEVVAVTNNLGNVRPQVHGHSGHLWVDWVDFESGDGSGEMAWTRLDAQGQWETIRYEPFVDVEHRDYLTRGGVRIQAIE